MKEENLPPWKEARGERYGNLRRQMARIKVFKRRSRRSKAKQNFRKMLD
jgi:hypothetical protein